MDDFNPEKPDMEREENSSAAGEWKTVNEADDLETDRTQTSGVNINAEFKTPPEISDYRAEQGNFYAAPGGEPPRKGMTGLKVFAIILSVVFLFLLLLFGAYVLYKESDKRTADASSTADATSEGPANAPELTINDTPETTSSASAINTTGELNTEDIAVKSMPSMVGIQVYTQSSAEDYTDAGVGSGVIMSEDGFIITNAHVVMGTDGNTPASKIDVYLSSGEVVEGTLIGADVKTDLAVVKIARNNLVPAEFGDSDALKVGERAIAIGNPTGLTLSSSLTQGVISGKDRSIPMINSGYTMKFIQTDAAISPGSSGGALINKYGQVVGINSMKFAAATFEGLGFAIPINSAKPVLEDLIANGFVSNRVRIGITFQSIPESMAELMNIPAGMRVVSVDTETDAHAKGIAAGDIITQVDGKQVITLDEVSVILAEKKAGDSVALTIYRAKDGAGDTLTVDVLLQQDITGKVK